MICGIDIAKETFYAAYQRTGEHFESKEFPNTDDGFIAFLKWCQKAAKKQPLTFGMEATGRYHEALAIFLHDQGHTVFVANPILIKRYTQSRNLRAKTDKIDAIAICRFFAQDSHSIQPFQPPSETRRKLISLWRCREQVIKIRTAEINRLKEPMMDLQASATHQRILGNLSEEIKHLEQLMAELISSDPELKDAQKRLLSVPGIGQMTSTVILAELPPELEDTRAGIQHFGLAPQPRESGTSVQGKAHISKASSKTLRPLLFMAARAVARSPYGPFRAFFDSLMARGKHYMCAITALMRKILATAIGVLRNGTMFDPDVVSFYRENRT